MTFILGILGRLLGGGAVSFITSKLGIVAIMGVLLLVTNLIGGLYWNVNGYNRAIAKCNTQSLKREISELKRDRDTQKVAADFLALRVQELEGRAAAGDQKVADYEAELAKRKNDPCVLTPADLGGVRPRPRK